jgi:hypothetical protein
MGLGQDGLVPEIERAQTLRDPIFLDRPRVKVLVEVASFDLG